MKTIHESDIRRARSHSSAGRVPVIGMIFTVLLLISAGTAVTAWILLQRSRPPIAVQGDSSMSESPIDDPAMYISMVMPEFSLVDQDEKPWTRDSFAGKYTILAFTFTNCPVICPIMYSHMIRVQHTLEGSPVRTVSISVDPRHDTPSVLRQHADKFGIDTSRWSFLTGEADEISRITQGLRFSVVDDPSLKVQLPDGNTMNNIDHPTRLILIGPDVTVHAMENGLEWSSVERLAKIARRRSMTPETSR